MSVDKHQKGASDRDALIRLATQLPSGSGERRTLLRSIVANRREPGEMKLWNEWWGQVNDGFGKGLAGAISSGPAKVGYREGGTITLNYGPTFGIRYISMGIRGGGSTAPNDEFPPEFVVVVDISSRNVLDRWPGLAHYLRKMEADITEVVSTLSKRELARLGKIKIKAQRGRYWSIAVKLASQTSPPTLNKKSGAIIEGLGSQIGKAVNRVLVEYQKEYEASREDRIDGLEDRIEDTQTRRKFMWEDADRLMAKADEDPYAEGEAEDKQSEAYQMGIEIIRLQEQLSGITGKKYPRPEFREAASEREALIKLASSLPVGSDERRVILVGLQKSAAAQHVTGKTAYSITELGQLLSDPLSDYDRAEISDWGVNTIRDRWPAVFKRYKEQREGAAPHVPRMHFDSRALQAQMLREEFDHIKKGNLSFKGYLRVNRGGSGFILDRKMRMAIYAHYATRKALRSRFAADDRSTLIRLAAALPAGSEERQVILSGLQKTAARHPLDGVRKHQLMPNNIARKIPKLYSQEDVEDPTVWVKFFSPYGRGVWYVTEFDGRDRMFGWADVGHGELGYMSLKELQSANRNGLPLVERDLSWKPLPLSKAKGR